MKLQISDCRFQIALPVADCRPQSPATSHQPPATSLDACGGRSSLSIVDAEHDRGRGGGFGAAARPIIGDPLYPAVIDVARDDFSDPLRLLAQCIEFDDPVSECLRRFARTSPFQSASLRPIHGGLSGSRTGHSPRRG